MSVRMCLWMHPGIHRDERGVRVCRLLTCPGFHNQATRNYGGTTNPSILNQIAELCRDLLDAHARLHQTHEPLYEPTEHEHGDHCEFGLLCVPPQVSGAGPGEVVVEGSIFPIPALPTLLAKHMRALSMAQRELKEAHIELSELRAALTELASSRPNVEAKAVNRRVL